MSITLGLFNGLLLLARLHLKGKVSVDEDRVTFYINVEDRGVMSKTHEELLDTLGWVLVEYKEIELWVYPLSVD